MGLISAGPPRVIECDRCHGRFTSTSTEAEALAEEKSAFGFNERPEARVTLCDDCYRKIMDWIGTRPQPPETTS